MDSFEFDKDRLQNVFYIFDRNNEGLLDFQSIVKIFKIYGKDLSKEDLNILEKKLVLECKNKISFSELIDIISEMNIEFSYKEELNEIFDFFDTGNKGYILVDDLKSNLLYLGEVLTEKEIEECMKDIDNMDGKITYENFLRIMKK